MEYSGKERRKYKRIKIPGTKVNYIQIIIFFSKKRYCEEFCPVEDISRGGIRFLCRRLFSAFKKKISMQIYIPGEKSYLNLTGRVKWKSLNPSENYQYKIGVQFIPFGEKKEYNNPDTLKRINELLQKFFSQHKLNSRTNEDQ